MIMARMRNLLTPATVARQECVVSWAVFTEQNQSIFSEGDFMDSCKQNACLPIAPKSCFTRKIQKH